MDALFMKVKHWNPHVQVSENSKSTKKGVNNIFSNFLSADSDSEADFTLLESHTTHMLMKKKIFFFQIMFPFINRLDEFFFT